MDYTSLAHYVGVDAKTIRRWLSILESSFILASDGAELIAIEIKASSTYRESFLGNIKKLEKLTSKIKASYLVYTGDTLPISDRKKAVRFDRIDSIFQA